MLRRGLVLLALLATLPDMAVAAPPPLPAAAQPDPLKIAFEALPEPERRAVQAALIWTADFAGAVTGGYGPRTRDALLAAARRTGVAPGAALDPAPRARLLAEADAARRAVGFTVLRDPRTGIAIGIPTALAPLRSSLPDGTRYASADGAFAVELSTRPGAGPGGLDDALARLTRDAPGRRVTYRLQKPDFVVVTGEAGDAAFYARSALDPSAPPGAAGAVRGFVVSHPRAGRTGAVALAVAASFDPFPAAAAPPAALTGQAAAATRAAPPPAAASIRTPDPLVGTAVLVAPGLALTRIDGNRCPHPEAGGAPADWVRQDAATGLALLRVAGHGDAAAVRLSGGGDAVLALFLVPGDGEPSLSAAAARGAGAGRISAPLQGVDAGAVLLDGGGALAGLTEARDGGPVLVAGVVAEARYGMVEAGPIAAFLNGSAIAAAPAGSAMAPGEAAARWRPAILPLRCRAA